MNHNHSKINKQNVDRKIRNNNNNNNNNVNKNHGSSHFIQKCSIFDKVNGKKLIESIVEVIEGLESLDSYLDSNLKQEKNDHESNEKNQTQSNSLSPESIKNLTISDKYQCSTCSSSFNDRDEQVKQKFKSLFLICYTINNCDSFHLLKIDHYKGDLHLFNLKQKLKGKPIVTEEEFEKLSDISSISGSEDEDEENFYSSTSSSSESDSENEDASKPYHHIASKKPKISFKLNDSTVLVMLRCILHGKKVKFLFNFQSLKYYA